MKDNCSKWMRSGFSLVEVTLALGIAAFCLLALFGLLPIGLSSNQAAVEQTTAAGVAMQLVSELREMPTTSTKTAVLKLPFTTSTSASANPSSIRYFAATGSPSGTDGTQFVASGADESRYRACVGLLGSSTGTVSVRIVVAWPAIADRTNTGWPKKFEGTYEIVTALDRR